MPEWIADILKQTAGILLAGVPLLIPNVRDFVMKRIQMSFDKAVEDRKGLNARIIDISKIQFEKEFDVYREVSKVTAFLVYSSKFLADRILEGKEGIDLVRTETMKSYVNADKIIGENAPFITQELAAKYRALLEKCDELLRLSAQTSLLKEDFQKIKDLKKNIIDQNNDVENSLRKHLESLRQIKNY